MQAANYEAGKDFALEGDELGRRFTLRFKGLAVTCAARVRQAHVLLRDAHGVWRQFSAPMPGGRRIPIYVSVDRN
eukprot:2582442-Pyramimonas_sp.AAC.1